MFMINVELYRDNSAHIYRDVTENDSEIFITRECWRIEHDLCTVTSVSFPRSRFVVHRACRC